MPLNSVAGGKNEKSQEAVIMKLNIRHFEHMMWKQQPLEKALTFGKMEGNQKWCRQKTRWLDCMIDDIRIGL